MIRVPLEDAQFDFIEWVEEENQIRRLPKGFTVRTRVRLVPAKGIPEYLKKPGATGFTMAARYPRDWLTLVNVTQEAMLKIRKKGWTPEVVEVFIRWEPEA